MGRFDNVVMLDEPLTCPVGHPLAGLQTKSFPDPSMSTYLIRRDRVVRAARGSWRDDDEDERSAWRVSGSGDAAVHETVYQLEPVTPPADVSAYTHRASTTATVRDVFHKSYVLETRSGPRRASSLGMSTTSNASPGSVSLPPGPNRSCSITCYHFVLGESLLLTRRDVPRSPRRCAVGTQRPYPVTWLPSTW
ncbi:MAG: hypothetical protein BMS9Abin37_0274 [Acidobacteriota bacterium]|nr:MAG: hypothetical protein BMS9Abin37_0274 [Acidobacteriota bacterium]